MGPTDSIDQPEGRQDQQQQERQWLSEVKGHGCWVLGVGCWGFGRRVNWEAGDEGSAAMELRSIPQHLSPNTQHPISPITQNLITTCGGTRTTRRATGAGPARSARSR